VVEELLHAVGVLAARLEALHEPMDALEELPLALNGLDRLLRKYLPQQAGEV
jgi:hypothetical protein